MVFLPYRRLDLAGQHAYQSSWFVATLGERLLFLFLFRKCRRLSSCDTASEQLHRDRLWCLYHRTVFHLHGQLPRYTLYLSLSTHHGPEGIFLSTLSLGSTHPVGSGRVLREEGEGWERGWGVHRKNHQTLTWVVVLGPHEHLLYPCRTILLISGYFFQALFSLTVCDILLLFFIRFFS